MTRQKIKMPVCIVGAGVSGLSTAMSCYDHSLPFILVDANSTVTGETSQCGGFLTLGYYIGIDDLEDMIGTELTGYLWELALDSVDLLKNRLSYHQIDCGLEMNGWLRTCLWSQAKEDLLYRYLETMRDTFSYSRTEIFNHEQISQFYQGPKSCGFFEPESGRINVMKYVEGMKRVLREKDLAFHESDPCQSVETLPNSYIVKTEKLEIECEVLILATGFNNYNLFNAERRVYRNYHLASSKIELLDRPLPHTEAAKKLVFSGLEAEQAYWKIDNDGHLYFGCNIEAKDLEPARLAKHLKHTLATVFNPDLSFRILNSKTHNFIVGEIPFPDIMNPESRVYLINSFQGKDFYFSGITGELIAKDIAGKSPALELFTKSPVWSKPAYNFWKQCEHAWKDVCKIDRSAAL